jgi:hypothetical protein
MSREPVKEILYTPPDHATTERAEAPIPPAAVASVSDNATKDTPEATQPPRIILPRAGAPARTEQPAPTAPEPAFARSAPGPSPVHADQGAAGASVAGQPPAMPPAVEANATDANLPPIANPFDDPGPNSPFQQFPSVPLPIHGEFAYAAPPKKVSRSRRASSWRSHLSAKPLILWAAVLALVCFGANALVRYKISSASRRFASESGTYTASKSAGSDASAATPADDSGATAASPAPTDSPSEASNADAGSNDRAAISSQPAASVPATNSQKDSTVADASSASSSQTSPRRESSLDTRSNRENAAYAATAPPDSDRSGGNARASQPAPTPRSWTAPAPTRSSTSVVAADDAPQSPNVSSSSEVAEQSAPLPAASQTRPTPPPTSVVQASNANTAASNSAPAPNPGASASSAPVRSQPTANTQPSGNGSNGNTTPPSRSQSPIYNANTPAQRSAIIGSINSVHSSGIFDSNDSTSTSASAANSAAPPPSRGANANVAARPAASNGYVAPSDVPQDRDVEIPAPKGFNASWVDLPGEHVVRSTAGTVHIHRLVRVPGERVPGQRWLWRGKFNVTVGDVLNRIDPSVVQASGASGSLTVMASIDKDGYVTDLKPLNGNFALLPAVSRTVRNWHYQPTYVDNKRAETQAQIEFDLRPVTASNRTARP